VLEPADSDPLVMAVEQAVRLGLIVVVSAGNYGRGADGSAGYAGINSPGNAPSAITVGAYDSRHTVSRLDDSIAAFSSRGPTWYDAYAKPDLVAPGQGIVASAAPESSLFRRYPERRVAGRDGRLEYFRLSGTSMSAAVTSGAVALILEANRKQFRGTLTPNIVKAILQYSALSVGPYDALTQGTGALNVPGAIALARRIELAYRLMTRVWLLAPRAADHSTG
jgi:serine protease AprX